MAREYGDHAPRECAADRKAADAALAEANAMTRGNPAFAWNDPTYRALVARADALTRTGYHAGFGLCAREDDPSQHDRPVSPFVARARAGMLPAKVLA